MPTKRPLILIAAALITASALAAPAVTNEHQAAEQWWSDISNLADDRMEGRMPGTPGFQHAADYVLSRFRAEGLQPAGTDGTYLQPVDLVQQNVDQKASSLRLLASTGATTSLKVGELSRIGAGGDPLPAKIDAPLVFLGYGLHLPTQGADDFAGMDLKGKVVVVISGGPAQISGALKSNARFARAEQLGKLGALGIITLTTPKQVEIPWARQLLLALQPGMYLTDPALREAPDGFLSLALDPAQSEILFTGAGHSFAELAALADASQAVPRFELPFRLQGTIVSQRTPLTSMNLVAALPGHDSKLKKQYVVVSAHLDHLGVGAPINGDAIYNGAMDDASGVATVFDIAHRLKASKLHRSVLFLVVTAEERGLLGSYFFARRPTVPAGSLVADFNFDMALPLWPLTKVFVPGEGESTLGADARAVAAQRQLTLVPDPLPDRNVFIRTDQFSFVRTGVPAVAFKFGFEKNTPEFQIEHDWRATRYHAPSDDLQQPVMREEAVKLDAFVADMVRRVADADDAPAWLPTSDFRPGGAVSSP